MSKASHGQASASNGYSVDGDSCSQWAEDIISRLVRYRRSKYEPLYEQDIDFLGCWLREHDKEVAAKARLKEAKYWNERGVEWHSGTKQECKECEHIAQLEREASQGSGE